jgi:hypothetical protein
LLAFSFGVAAPARRWQRDLLRETNGEIRHTAEIPVREGKTIIHTQSNTDSLRSAACRWAKHRKAALEDPEELQGAQEGERQHAEGYLLCKVSAAHRNDCCAFMAAFPVWF